MTKNEKMAIARKLINAKINETLEMWAGKEELTTYAWGWRDIDTVSSNHDGQFFNMDDIAAICKVLKLNYTLTVGLNLDNKPTPFVMIF